MPCSQKIGHEFAQNHAIVDIQCLPPMVCNLEELEVEHEEELEELDDEFELELVELKQLLGELSEGIGFHLLPKIICVSLANVVFFG